MIIPQSWVSAEQLKELGLRRSKWLIGLMIAACLSI